MRTCFVFMVSVFAFSILGLSGYAQSVEAGRKIEQSACTPCHSLRLVDSQRLSIAAWEKEVNKMVGWGATVSDRQTLIDYLSSQYSDAKPVPAPPLSADGVGAGTGGHAR